MKLRSQPGPEDTQHLVGLDPSHPGHRGGGCFAIHPNGATVSPTMSITADGRGPADHSKARLYLEIRQISGFIILCKSQGEGEKRKNGNLGHFNSSRAVFNFQSST